jgi:hypothetical protein
VLPDYRDLRAASNNYAEQFDVIIFDPPYVSKGGRETSGIPEFDARYGLKDAPRTPMALHEYNRDGLEEAFRICRPGGFVMTKVCPYISSGRFQPADRWMENDAESMGFTVHDRLIHVGNARTQPSGKVCDACGGRAICRQCGQDFPLEGGGAVPAGSTARSSTHGTTTPCCSCSRNHDRPERTTREPHHHPR